MTLPAWPLAIMDTISLVEVSPIHADHTKGIRHAKGQGLFQHIRSMLTSVVKTEHSGHVGMDHPEPLAMPAMQHS